ncbi:MAG: VOC family protein [Acidimicrobiia bacterium]|jgi:PhnB protein|nr:VOC family protein [Acidimicrobiia bacterium]MBP8182301.1 VOC family protein [Acidimicrobiia bacterium]
MSQRLNPYLNFDGNTREAMEFYQNALGGELLIHTFGEYGAPEGIDPNGVMHAMLETPAGFTLMASDLPPGMDGIQGTMMNVSISGEDEEALRGYWDKLSDGANIVMPLEKQMWGDTFGSLFDKFGTPWMVNIVQNQQ